jgi:hypothetical protein
MFHKNGYDIQSLIRTHKTVQTPDRRREIKHGTYVSVLSNAKNDETKRFSSGNSEKMKIGSAIYAGKPNEEQ